MRGREKRQELISVASKLGGLLKSLGDPKMTAYASSLLDALGQYDATLKAGVPVSSLNNGLIQGLSEVPAILDDFEPGVRSKALKLYYGVILREAPDLLAELDEIIERVMSRGSISTEHEYHMVRAVIDMNTADPEDERDRELMRILDAYAERDFRS